MPSAGSLRYGRAAIQLSLLGAREIDKGLKKLESRMRDFGKGLRAAGSSGLKIAGALGSLFAISVKLSANMEKMRAAFTAFTGDADKAAKILAELEQFALVTPFQTEDLADATKSLLIYGIAADDVVRITKQLGKASAGDAEKLRALAYAFGQVNTATRLMGSEARQLQEAGFAPLTEIAKRTGETVGEVKARMEAGGVSFQEVAQALKDATGEGGRFHTILDEINKTAVGQANNIREALSIVARTIGDALLPKVKEYLMRVQELVPVIGKWVKDNTHLVESVASGTVKLLAFSAAMYGLGVVFGGVHKALLLARFGLKAFMVTLTIALAHPVIAAIGAIATAIGLIAAAWHESRRAMKAYNDDFWKRQKEGNFEKRARAAGVLIAPDKGPAAGAGGPGGGTKKPTPTDLSGFTGAMSRALTIARAGSLRAQFETLVPARSFLDRAREAFEKAREHGEEAQRLDDEIARARIDGMKEGLAKEKAILDLERQIKTRELQEAGQLTPDMKAKLEALFGARAAAAGLDLTKQDRMEQQQALFDTRHARQIFGGRDEQLEVLRDIRRNTDPRSRRNDGGIAVV